MKKILSILLACTLLTACSTGETNSSYNRSYVGQEAQIQFGKIIAIYPVKIEGSSEVGVIGGAIAGGAAGSMIGGNTAINVIGAVGGAIAGGITGGTAEKAITKDSAFQFIIEKQNGIKVSIVQSNEDNLQVGENVIISYLRNETHIKRYP